MAALRVIPVDRLDFTFEPRPWAYAEADRTGIQAYFDTLKAAKPALWNGRVLLLGPHMIEGRRISGSFFDTDFASMIAWRDRGFPEAAAVNCFAMAALRGDDGGFLLGVMGEDTVNAGHIYFPAGTPDPDDIAGGTVDLENNVWRELEEETGLRRDGLDADPGWRAVLAGPRLALMKVVRAPESAERLRARIVDWLGRQTSPELSDIRVVHGPDDLDPMMPEFVRAFLTDAWSRPDA